MVDMDILKPQEMDDGTQKWDALKPDTKAFMRLIYKQIAIDVFECPLDELDGDNGDIEMVRQMHLQGSITIAWTKKYPSPEFYVQIEPLH